MTFEEFSAANRKRCEESFGRRVDPGSAVAMVLGIGEEAGEVAGAARAHLRITKRKNATVEDIGDELADLVSYCDLLASCLGFSLADALARKFNRVSERIGSPVRLNDRASSTAPVAPVQPTPETQETAGDALAAAVEEVTAGVLDPDEGYCLNADCDWSPTEGGPHDCVDGRLLAALAAYRAGRVAPAVQPGALGQQHSYRCLWLRAELPATCVTECDCPPMPAPPASPPDVCGTCGNKGVVPVLGGCDWCPKCCGGRTSGETPPTTTPPAPPTTRVT